MKNHVIYQPENHFFSFPTCGALPSSRTKRRSQGRKLGQIDVGLESLRPWSEHAELLQLSFEKAVLLHENHHESTLWVLKSLVFLWNSDLTSLWRRTSCLPVFGDLPLETPTHVGPGGDIIGQNIFILPDSSAELNKKLPLSSSLRALV